MVSDAQGGHFSSKELPGSLGPVPYSDKAQGGVRSPRGTVAVGSPLLQASWSPASLGCRIWGAGRPLFSQAYLQQGPGNLSCFGSLKPSPDPAGGSPQPLNISVPNMVPFLLPQNQSIAGGAAHRLPGHSNA